MRTTVTLDPDIEAAIDRLRRERGLGLSEAINHLARAGLTVRSGNPRFRQRRAKLGLRIDVTNVAEAIEQVDGPTSR